MPATTASAHRAPRDPHPRHSEAYTAYLASPEWDAKRRAALARTSWQQEAIPDDPRSYAALVASVAAFRAHGEIGREMIARLDALLDRLQALPIEDAAGWRIGVARYLGLRYGPLPRPLPPGAWPWQATLRAWQMAGWGVAIVARRDYAALSPNQQRQAVAEFGAFKDAKGNDAPLLLMCWPQGEEDRLDRRAAGLGIDVRARQLIEHRERLQRIAATKAKGQRAC